MGQYRGYNDEWIREKISQYSSWRKMFDDYFQIFHFGNYRNFRNHLYNDLGYTRLFTEEQDRWIKENYPVLGREKAAVEFSKVFPCGRSKNVIAQRAMKLGVTVSEEVLTRIRKEKTVKHKVGDRVVRTNKEGVSSVWIKLQNGEWKRESHVNFGDVPDGMRIVHLDGDYTNNSASNLVSITKQESAMMTASKMWSEEPEITKTGIIWCRLKQAHEKAVQRQLDGNPPQ